MRRNRLQKAKRLADSDSDNSDAGVSVLLILYLLAVFAQMPALGENYSYKYYGNLYKDSEMLLSA